MALRNLHKLRICLFNPPAFVQFPVLSYLCPISCYFKLVNQYFMKAFQLLLLSMLVPVMCVWGNNRKQVEEHTSSVIIAVNEVHGGGYFVDSKGKRLFDKQFEGVGPFSEGLARVKQNGKWGYVNLKGEVVIPCVYDWGLADRAEFSEGLACVRKNWRYGYINAEGEQVIPCIYDEADQFSEGHALVKQHKKYGFVNVKGEEVIPCIYEYAMAFSDGLAFVW